MRIAKAAEAREELALAVDCYGKLANLIYPKPRPIELDPDALVDLEGRVAAARAKSMKEGGMHPLAGLGDQLELMARIDRGNEREAEYQRKQRQAELQKAFDAGVASLAGGGESIAQLMTLPAPAPAPAAPVAQPVPTPSPAPTPVAPLGSDWGAPTYRPIFSEQDFADHDYDALSDGLIATRNK